MIARLMLFLRRIEEFGQASAIEAIISRCKMDDASQIAVHVTLQGRHLLLFLVHDATLIKQRQAKASKRAQPVQARQPRLWA